MDREAWRAVVHRVAKSRTQLRRLSTLASALKLRTRKRGSGPGAWGNILRSGALESPLWSAPGDFRSPSQ